MSLRQKVLEEINAERDRQELKWGRQDHQPERWLSILGEEHGEVCKAVCEASFPGYETTGDWSQYRKELIHVAAVACAMAECFDRRGEVLAEGCTWEGGRVVNEWKIFDEAHPSPTAFDLIDAHNKKVVEEAMEVSKKYEEVSVDRISEYLSMVKWSKKSPEVLLAVREAYLKAHTHVVEVLKGVRL